MRPTSTRVTLAALIALTLPGCVALPHGGHFASVNGVRLYYEVRGHGPALLLLHGGGGDSHQLPKQAAAFAHHYTVIAPESRGHGRSTDSDQPLHYHQMAEDLVALLDRLKVRRADVVGWSDGGNLGLDLAMNHPDRIGKVVTFGANYRPEGMDDYTQSCAGEPDTLILPPGLPRAAILDRKLHHLWCTEPRWTAEDLGRIRVPVLIAVGDHDAVRPEHALALWQAIPGAQMCVIPGATHGALLEKPALCNRIILEFLGKTVKAKRK